MKTAVCYEFGKPLVVEEVPTDPSQAGEVMVKLAACAISPYQCHLFWLLFGLDIGGNYRCSNPHYTENGHKVTFFTFVIMASNHFSLLVPTFCVGISAGTQSVPLDAECRRGHSTQSVERGGRGDEHLRMMLLYDRTEYKRPLTQP